MFCGLLVGRTRAVPLEPLPAAHQTARWPLQRAAAAMLLIAGPAEGWRLCVMRMAAAPGLKGGLGPTGPKCGAWYRGATPLPSRVPQCVPRRQWRQ